MMRLVGLVILMVCMGINPPKRIRAQIDTTCLAESYRLVRTPAPGEVAHFQIIRLGEILDGQGHITILTRSAGSFSTEVLYVNEDGSWMDRYTWSSFFSGRSTSVSDSIVQVEITAVRDFTYDLLSNDRFSLPPVPIGGLEKTPDTSAFFVLTWDAAAFMQAATPQAGYPIRNLSKVGDRISETTPRKPAQFDFTPTVSKFVYKRGPFSTTFTGMTRVSDIPCALLHFESGANALSLRFSPDRMQTDLSGSEWIQGTLSIGLETRRIMAGTMRNMLVATQTTTLPGKTIQSPIVFRQNITIEQVTKE